MNQSERIRQYIDLAYGSLEHGLEHLKRGDLELSPKDLMFAIMHVDHAAQLLVKAKLTSIGEAIFKTDKRTISHVEGLGRLKEKGTICSSEWDALIALNRERDNMQHQPFVFPGEKQRHLIKDAYSFFKRMFMEFEEHSKDIEKLLDKDLISHVCNGNNP